MYKTSRGATRDMYFADDGFAVGIAYCLAILQQVYYTYTHTLIHTYIHILIHTPTPILYLCLYRPARRSRCTGWRQSIRR
jgi:uncharacterized protein YqiB (DUF1249 family)